MNKQGLNAVMHDFTQYFRKPAVEPKGAHAEHHENARHVAV